VVCFSETKTSLAPINAPTVIMPARKKDSSSGPSTGISKDQSAFDPVDGGVVAHAKTLTRKEPPPESPESVRIRTAVVLSFWAVVIFLGLPIWWKTTAIYRAKLPLREMMEWADGKVGCFLSLTPPQWVLVVVCMADLLD
jgi:Phosphatidylinositol-glycan biosynthesis class S protein